MREASLVLPQGQTEAAALVRTGQRAAVAPGGGANRTRGRRAAPGLPILLAGPILRRSSAQEIVVWVATSVGLSITGRVLDPQLDGQGNPTGTPTELGRGTAQTTRIGANLHLAWISIRAASQFRTGRILTYDLTFHAPNEHVEFTQPGLLPRDAVAYGSLGLPSFILDPQGVTRTHIMHASCRKLGGDGADASAEIDARLRQKHNNAQQRPRFLLLTGDQIYADDVPEDLARSLARASRLLLGFREALPRSGPLAPGGPTLDSLTTRAGLVRDNGITAEGSACEHHLLGFGEFAAMYLLSWSPALWDAPAMEDLPPGTARARNYEDTVKLRRALANVPTYMQLDDHEITDDWPLDTTMTGRLDRSPIGKWIIANGLASCWLFQLQGNGLGQMPALQPLATYLSLGAAQARLPEPSPSGDAATNVRQHIADNLEASREAYVRAAYGISGLCCVTPTVPPVLLLDTRTQRELTADSAPGLLNGAGRGWITREASRLPGGSPSAPLLLVSPAPVIGNPTYDLGLQSGGEAGARYYFDREAWRHNEASFRRFLDMLRATGRKVVVFSGDVHHGFTATGVLGQGAGALRMVQLTSSGARNRPTGAKLEALQRVPPERVTNDPMNGFFPCEFVRMPAYGNTVFLHNNVGFVTLDWTSGTLSVTHELRGQGHTGTATASI